MNRPRSTHNHFAGAHKFASDGPRRFEAFEVFYVPRNPARLAGWYWRPLPAPPLDAVPVGPFTSSRAAYRDACKQN